MVGGAAAAFALLAFAVASYSWKPVSAAGPSLVAILPFAYHGASDLGYTSDGMMTLLSAGMDHLGSLRTVNPRLMLDAAHSPADRVTPEAAASTARRFGAGTFVLGDITEAGRRLRISATLYDERARPVGAPVEVEGASDSLFALADALAKGLVSGHASTGTASVSSAAAQGTRSIQALRAFVQGEREFRAGRHDAAIVAYREATTTDSTFALAYLRMSQAANWTGDYRLQRLADEDAQRLRDRLPQRERLRAEAWHLSMGAGPQRPESLYRVLVAQDPTDGEAWYYLADLVFHQGPAAGWPASESRPSWERAIALNPDDASALVHLARLVAADGERTVFDSLARRLAQLPVSDELAFEVRALRAFAFGDAAERLAVSRAVRRSAAKVSVGIEFAGHVTGASSDLEGVDAFWSAIDRDMPTPESRGPMLLHRASIAFARGDGRLADALVDSAKVLTPAPALRYEALLATVPFLPPRTQALERSRRAIARGDTIALAVDAAAWRHFFAGVIALRQRDSALARRELAALDTGTRPQNAGVQLAPILRAELAVARDRAGDALAALGPIPNVGTWIGDPSTSLESAHHRWLRAELLARLGRDREALRLFASLPSPTGGDIAYAPASHLRQAEILERLGDLPDAARHYRRALGYWRDAGPEVASLAQRARAGLARVDERKGVLPRR